MERFKEENQTDYFAVPPDLANALGPAATKAMREDLGLCTYCTDERIGGNLAWRASPSAR